MNKVQLKELVKHIISEIIKEKKLSEASVTGGVSCPATKFAFGKIKDRVARQGGMIPVTSPSAEVNEGKKKETKKKFENPAPKVEKPINEPIRKDDVDYINKEKKTALTKKDTKKVKSITKLQQLVKRASPFSRVDEDIDFNVKAEEDKFESAVDASEFKLKSNEIKVLKSKLLNKQVTAHASKGYAQVKRDYTFTVADVNIADYYGEYQVILKGSDKKEYFVDTDYKIKISGGAAPAPTAAPAAPDVTQKPESQPEAQPAPAAAGQPELTQQIKK